MRQARDDWKRRRQPLMRQQIDRLVFLDETGTTTKMTRLRGRSRRGTRLKAGAPFGHWATQTFIARPNRISRAISIQASSERTFSVLASAIA